MMTLQTFSDEGQRKRRNNKVQVKCVSIHEMQTGVEYGENHVIRFTNRFSPNCAGVYTSPNNGTQGGTE